MHDLVQEMGHHIVRGEHPNNPERHTRIWKRKDVLNICATDATKELAMVEAIRIYDYPEFNSKKYDIPPIVANAKNLRLIEWGGNFASHLLSNFPQRTLCSLKLYNCFSLPEQLWEGSKSLPYLKNMELSYMDSLIMTPDFSGLPNLERFILKACHHIKEIHPSIGRLEQLVFLYVEDCEFLEIFPPITRLKKLKILSFSWCPRLFSLPKIQEENIENLAHLELDNSGKEVASYTESSTNSFVTCLTCGSRNLVGVECCFQEPSLPHSNTKPRLHDSNNNHQGLRFFLNDLQKLYLNSCHLGDEEMGSAVWELPNLQELNLEGNQFSRFNFSLLRLPRLKRLNISHCYNLIELSELPSSIAVVIADFCDSLESFGDISNCKWLWKVRLLWENKLDADILVNSMLQGNALEDYFISVVLEHQTPMFTRRPIKQRTFTHDWCNEFCGFLIYVVSNKYLRYVNIVMKPEVDEDSGLEVWRESNEAVEPEFSGTMTYVGYVSFGSLRHTAFFNSSHTMVSVSSELVYMSGLKNERSCVETVLVPRGSKGDEAQRTKVATNPADFWDDGNTFTIEDDSKSSIKILWRLYDDRLHDIRDFLL